MVTHAKDIVDKMNKRVVAIEHGRIVRDEEGSSYGYKKPSIQEPQLFIPRTTIEEDNRQTVYLDQSAHDFTLARHEDAVHEHYGVDDMVSAYLNGGEDVYE